MSKHAHDRLNRRQFTRVCGATAITPLVANAAATSATSATRQAVSPSASDRSWIDAHVHVWTPDLEKYPLGEGFQREDMRPPSFTPEQLMDHAKPLGIERVTLIQMSYYRYDNSYMLDVIARHPNVFRGVAVIDPLDNAVGTMKRLKQHGVRGFRLRPTDVKDWLGSSEMRAMWKCGADENLAMCHLINPEFLDTLGQMCRRFPATPVVVDHFARVGIEGEIRESELRQLCDLARFQNVHVKVSAFYALGKKRPPYYDLIPMIRRVLDAFGPERLMWASDCPFQVQEPHTYRASVELLTQGLSDLNESAREWLMRKTAERVYFS